MMATGDLLLITYSCLLPVFFSTSFFFPGSFKVWKGGGGVPGRPWKGKRKEGEGGLGWRFLFSSQLAQVYFSVAGVL